MRDYRWSNFEAAPLGLSEPDVVKYNYNVFSARTGNIYTTTILKQWVDWAVGNTTPPEEVWQAHGRFYDPFRPAIEPDGFASANEVIANRKTTIRAFGQAIRKSDIFVFTLGLTESWQNLAKGYEYALCPGTVAGKFDAGQHSFVNLTYAAVSEALQAAIAMMRQLNPNLRVLLTVSPVPLTATATDNHVLVATNYSKSTLRAVAGDIAAEHPNVDYFPSYEIINSAPYGGMFFAANKRSVLPQGVDHVMRSFFDGQMGMLEPDQQTKEKVQVQKARAERADVVCEEALLGAFGPRA